MSLRVTLLFLVFTFSLAIIENVTNLKQSGKNHNLVVTLLSPALKTKKACTFTYTEYFNALALPKNENAASFSSQCPDKTFVTGTMLLTETTIRLMAPDDTFVVLEVRNVEYGADKLTSFKISFNKVQSTFEPLTMIKLAAVFLEWPDPEKLTIDANAKNLNAEKFALFGADNVTPKAINGKSERLYWLLNSKGSYYFVVMTHENLKKFDAYGVNLNNIVMIYTMGETLATLPNGKTAKIAKTVGKTESTLSFTKKTKDQNKQDLEVTFSFKVTNTCTGEAKITPVKAYRGLNKVMVGKFLEFLSAEAVFPACILSCDKHMSVFTCKKKD